MKSEQCDQYEESEQHDQSMERLIISNYGIGMDWLEMSFYGKRYVHGQHRQFLAVKEKYDTSKYIDKYMSLAHYIIFTKISEKGESNSLQNEKLWLCSNSTNNLMMDKCLERHFWTNFNDELSGKDRKNSLEEVKLINEKLCVNIKGISCANGSQQKNYLKQDDTVYSPTCSTESLMSTLFIDSMEQRDVVVFAVPGYYLQTEIP